VTIECTKEYIRFSVAGDIGTGNIKIRARDSDKKDERTILEVDEDVQLSFALRYLNMFSKASSLSSQVVLCMSKDAPLIVDFKIENLGSLKFYLAPKINEEETA
jgi:proliferating cell nuclear antigen